MQNQKNHDGRYFRGMTITGYAHNAIGIPEGWKISLLFTGLSFHKYHDPTTTRTIQDFHSGQVSH
jgi:hypothetical protein